MKQFPACDVLIVGSSPAAVLQALQLRRRYPKNTIMLITRDSGLGGKICNSYDFTHYEAEMDAEPFRQLLPRHGVYPVFQNIKRTLELLLLRENITLFYRTSLLGKRKGTCLLLAAGGLYSVEAGDVIDFESQTFPVGKSGLLRVCRRALVDEPAATGTVRFEFRNKIYGLREVWEETRLSNCRLEDWFSIQQDVHVKHWQADEYSSVTEVSFQEDSVQSESSQPQAGAFRGNFQELADIYGLAEPFVTETCDVLVAGGGTAGMPAAIAAAEEGANVILAERQDGPGGVAVQGRIANQYHGNRIGFALEFNRAVAGLDPERKASFAADGGRIEWKKHELLRRAKQAGCRLRFGFDLCGAELTPGRKLAWFATPWGIAENQFACAVDATGNATLAEAAGAKTLYGGGGCTVQGVGVPALIPGEENSNSDFTYVDERSPEDVTRVLVMARNIHRDSFDSGWFVNSRERYRIVSELNVRYQDILLGKEYADTLVLAKSVYDTHGFTADPFFEMLEPDRRPMFAPVPLRSLLPKDMDGLLVIGLGLGVDRDAIPFMRMQPDFLNLGYAAGLTAWEAAKTGMPLRQLDLKPVQQKLIGRKILQGWEQLRNVTPPWIRTLPPDTPNVPEYLAAALDQPEQALPVIQEYFQETQDLRLAQLLLLLGDESGAHVLAEEVAKYKFDSEMDPLGCDCKGMGAKLSGMSRIDKMIVSLGRGSGKYAEQAVLEKLQELETESFLSHIKSVSLFWIRHPNPMAAVRLEGLLQALSAGRGHAELSLLTVAEAPNLGPLDITRRNVKLKEIYLAGALWRCQPGHALAGTILNKYARGLEVVYARCAQEFLGAK